MKKTVILLVENIIKGKKRISGEEFINLLRNLPNPKIKEFKWKEMKREYYEGKLHC